MAMRLGDQSIISVSLKDIALTKALQGGMMK